MSNNFNEKQDANGRFLAPEAYLPKTIGGSIIEIFGGMNLPRQAGIDVVNVLLGQDGSDACSNPDVLEGITRLGADIKSMFIDGKTTENEFRLGLEYILSECEQFPDTDSVNKAIDVLEAQIKDLEGKANGDSKTIH